MTIKIFNIIFGALAAPIREQLLNQGLTMTPEKCKLVQSLAESAVRLNIAGVLTDSEKRKVYRRIIRIIARSAVNNTP